MTDSLTGSLAAGDMKLDDESRMLLGFLKVQRDAVLKTVEGLPEEYWQRPVVPSGWTVAGMLWHLGGVEHHWLQDVVSGVVEEELPDSAAAADLADEEEPEPYDPMAAFVCDMSAAELIGNYRDECRRSDSILAVTPMAAAPKGLEFHPDPEYTRQITTVGWVVMHAIEETAVHQGHLEIARELLDGATRLAER